MEEYLKKQLQRTGYPLEIEISSILDKKGWVPFNNELFLDETGIEREIDIHAVRSRVRIGRSTNKSEETFYTDFNLVIECKKSADWTWIFFTRPTMVTCGAHFFFSGQYLDFLQALTGNTQGLKDRIFSVENSHYDNFRNVASTYTEIKTSNQMKTNIRTDTRKKEIFEGINQLTGFLNYDMLHRRLFIKEKPKPLVIVFYFAVIVFDGKLYEAITKEGELELKEQKHILLHVQRYSKYLGTRLFFSIDIVKKEYFVNYLEDLEKDMHLIREKISSNRDSLMSYSRKIMKREKVKKLIVDLLGR